MIHAIAMFFLITTGLQAQSTPVIKYELSEWLVPLREAIYEQQLSADEIRLLYVNARTAAQRHYNGIILDLTLSHCEYFMGRALQEEDRNDEARSHYNKGMELAEKALEAEPSPQAWVLRAQHLSQLCSINSITFTMSNGLNIERYARNALDLDSRNAAAQYLIAARWVYAPSPLGNIRRGIQMMMDIIDNGDMEKDDLFNVYFSIGYGYVQQRRYDDAQPWIIKSLGIYPTNKLAVQLLERRGR